MRWVSDSTAFNVHMTLTHVHELLNDLQTSSGVQLEVLYCADCNSSGSYVDPCLFEF